MLDPETHHAYQQTYFHALGKDKVGKLIEGYYQAFFRSLSEATGTDYAVETYSDQQATPGFRAEFLRTLERLVDEALGALGTSAGQMPIRVFTPQVLAPTGAKLSKSLLREQGRAALPPDVEPWMLDTTAWPGSVADYVDALVWLVGELLADPKHFFRSFTVKELGRLVAARPSEPAVRAHEMGIYKRYFDLIATGRKTIEIRVNDASRRKIKKESLIRFNCQGDQVLTRVTKMAYYTSFEEMFDHEPVASVNPTAGREEQLANIRQIYPPEREALGVVAIGIELVAPPHST